MTAVNGGHNVDLCQYAADGIVLAGRLKTVDQQKVEFQDDLERTLTEGEAWYVKFKRQMDDYADKREPPLPRNQEQPDLRSSVSKNARGIPDAQPPGRGRIVSCLGQGGTPAISRGSSCLCLTQMVIPSMRVV